MRQQGHTLVELMIATAVLGSLFAMLASTGSWLHRADRTAAAYVDDVRQSRRALAQLESDIREARRVERAEQGITVLLPGSVGATIDYRLQDGVLTRTTGDISTVLARCIGSLATVQAGRLVTLRLALQPRASNPGRQAAIDAVIYLRNGEP